MNVKLLLVVLHATFVLSAEPSDTSLKLLQVLFTNGARSPNRWELSLVGNDEYSPLFNNSDTLGELITLGKKQEYEFGQMLRKKYDQFLGDFKYNEVYARSTNVDRTKMSLQLVLAGAYPTTANTSWSDTIPWSPIPTFYEKKEFDFLAINYNDPCMKNGTLVAQALNSSDIAKRMEKYQELAKKLERTTAVKKLNPTNGYGLYFYLNSILHMNLSLPSWCTPDDFAQLREVANIAIDTVLYTQQMKRIYIGPTIEEFLKNIDNNENDTRKIYLYSAHGNNVAAFVRTHNFTGIPTPPDFGSAVIIEKLKSGDGQLYIRMLYWTGTTGQLIPVKLENCDNICLLSKYRSTIAPLLPSEDEKACFTPKL